MSKIDTWKNELEKAKVQADKVGKKVSGHAVAMSFLGRFDELTPAEQKAVLEYQRLTKRINDLERKIGQYWGE